MKWTYTVIQMGFFLSSNLHVIFFYFLVPFRADKFLFLHNFFKKIAQLLQVHVSALTFKLLILWTLTDQYTINSYVTSARSALTKKKSWFGSLIWGPFIKCIPFTKWFSHEKGPHWAHDWKIPYNFQLGLTLVGQ